MKTPAPLSLILLAALLGADPSAPSFAEPIAPRISTRFSPATILATMKKVADWQLSQAPRHPPDDWTSGVLYAGIMALSDVADDPRYHNAMVEMGSRQAWRPGPRLYHADDQCVGQTYLELYLQHRDPAMLQPIQAEFDEIPAHPATNDLQFSTDASSDRWSWCDSLFMAPPVWMRLFNATGDKRYLDFMDREWHATSDLLYDPQERLFFRDSRYFHKREANGKKVFWSRGNGWVLAGLARVLQNMPPDYADRAFFEQRFKDMAARIVSLQQSDGLWRSSLLDPDSYPLKETSGSGFYTFAVAWGINRGLLDRAAYEPGVRHAWRALLRCTTSDGRLEHVQPIGADPKSFRPEDTDVYGVGAFLLAGSEMYRLALSETRAAAYAAFLPQRMDDFAWENDRIAFRVYGPALERTGEVSSGIDVWVKRTRRPILEEWYYRADYHEDHGEGLDMYKVGPSRGCGGTGVWHDGKLYVAKNFLTWHMVECGPDRVTFELTYAPFDAGGVSVRETKRITLETGSNLNRIEIRMDWDWNSPEQLSLAVGIVKREGGGSIDIDPANQWMTYWEPEQPGHGTIGCGVIMTSPAKQLELNDQTFLVTRIRRGQPTVYYAGAGWTGSGDFPDKTAWTKYVSKFARNAGERQSKAEGREWRAGAGKPSASNLPLSRPTGEGRGEGNLHPSPFALQPKSEGGEKRSNVEGRKSSSELGNFRIQPSAFNLPPEGRGEGPFILQPSTFPRGAALDPRLPIDLCRFDHHPAWTITPN